MAANLLQIISQKLSSFSNSDNFWDLFNAAFGLSYDYEAVVGLRSQWQLGDFSNAPEIVVVSSNILGGANGAYASGTNTIYLSDTFVENATTNSLVNVLLEEYGHFVDAQVNQVDSAGDEGAIFAALVQGGDLSNDQLQQLRAENDQGVINLDRESILVEKNGVNSSQSFRLLTSSGSKLKELIINPFDEVLVSNNLAGLGSITSLDVSPLNNVLYGVVNGFDGSSLIKVNPFDGAINFIGKISSTGVTQITFAPNNGGLYGINGSNLYKINESNAQATQITTIPTARLTTGNQTIEFSPNGTLYGINSKTQYLLDPVTFKLETKEIRELVTLDQTTGVILNKIADLGLDSSPSDDIDYAPDGFIYYNNAKNQLIQLDPNNGLSKIIKNEVGSEAIASLPVVPSISQISDLGGNTLANAHLLPLDPLYPTTRTIQGYVGNIDGINPVDLYRIELSRPTNIEISLTDLVADADLTILDKTGNIISRNSSKQIMNNDERYSSKSLLGTYYIQIKPAGTVETNYTLSINAKPRTVNLLGPEYDASGTYFDSALEKDNEVVFHFSISEASDRKISFDYQTLDGTAIAEKDYKPTKGTVTFEPGETKKQISVTLIDDELEEDTEMLHLQLSNPKNIDLYTGNGLTDAVLSVYGQADEYDPTQTRIESARIYDDDNDYNNQTYPPDRLRWIEVTQATGEGQDWIIEAQGKAVFTVKLNYSTNEEVTIDYFTVDGSAKAGEDYQKTTGKLTFNKDSLIQTIVVPLINNSIAETTESFSINFRNISENANIFDPYFVAEIKDDDQDTFLITTKGYQPHLSLNKDANYIAFTTTEQLVPEDENWNSDVYIYDRNNGNVRLISVSPNGVAGNKDSFDPLISDDGNSILFRSDATNLTNITGGNGISNYYVRQFSSSNPTSGQTIPVNVSNVFWGLGEAQVITLDGTNLSHLFGSYVSDDGRYSVVRSKDSNNKSILLIKDSVNNTTTQAETSYHQISGFQSPLISGDGRFIAFTSSSILVANDANQLDDIFVYEISTKNLKQISIAFDGKQRNGSRDIELKSISDDGRYVAFISDASNLVKKDTNGYKDVFVHDIQTGATILGSLNADGTQIYDDVEDAFLSDDGQSVAYIYQNPIENQLFVRSLKEDFDGNNDDTITITGKVEWTDSAGNKHPVRLATVNIKDSSGIIKTTNTNDKGVYSATIPNQTGIQIEVLTQYGGTSNKVLFGANDNVHNVNSSNINFTIDNKTDSEQAFSIYDALFVGQIYAETVSSQFDQLQKKLTVRFPVDVDTTVYENSVGQIWIRKNDWQDWDATLHEYGHYLDDIDKLSDKPTGTYKHTAGKSNIPQHGKDIGVRLAWTEALGTYLGISSQQIASSKRLLPNAQIVGEYLSQPRYAGDTWHTDVEPKDVKDARTLDYDLETISGQRIRHKTPNVPEFIGNEGEGDEVAVSRIIWDLADDNSDTFASGAKDEIAIGHVELYKLLIDISKKTKLDRLEDIWNYFDNNFESNNSSGNNLDKLNLGNIKDDYKRAKLGAIFQEYNVSPNVVDFNYDPIIVNGKILPVLTWQFGNNNANDTFEIMIFNHDFSEKVIEKKLGVTERLNGEWHIKSSGVGEWTPELNTKYSNWTWNELGSNVGNYHIVITGSDTHIDYGNFIGLLHPENEQTGSYWSGAYTFEVTQPLDNAIADQNAKQGTAFNFQIPTNTFIDIDAGDVLNYSATLENGNALPNWLTFNPTTRTFSGTPTNDNVGSLNVKVTATDKTGANVSDIFVIAVENLNDIPTLANAIADQTTKQGDAFNFQIPTNTFTDIDAGDVLTYSATLENGNALPSWLTFNPTTQTFSGTPTNDNVGSLNVKAIATDKAGATISDVFTLTVENLNDVPTLANAIADQTTKQGNTFNFQIPTNTFTDTDAGDVLTYSATLENGNALPSWLTFNHATQTFSGIPASTDIGTLNVKVTASDRASATASDIFAIITTAIATVPETPNNGITSGTLGDDILIAAIGTAFNGENNIIFTGAGCDRIDLRPVLTNPNSGNNRIDTGSDNDIIYVSQNDVVFGGSGNDEFFAQDSKGGNRMSGGAGDDFFYLGVGDRALGGDGNDQFFVSTGGNNLLSGGAGSDIFNIITAGTIPTSTNTIIDFQIGTDKIGISGIAANALSISQVGANAVIATLVGGQAIATLTGIQASSLSFTNTSQFTFA